MKRLSTIFTVLSLIALSIIGCSKDDGGSDNNGNNSGNGTGNSNGNSNSGQTVTAITPDFLNGTWSHVEFEYDGVKFSNNANHQTEWNCVKKGSFVFTKNQVTLITNQYDDEDNTCTENRGTFNYTVENGKVYLVVQGKKELLDITKAGDNIVVSVKDEDGKTTKRTLTKTSSNSTAPAAKKATAKITVSGVTNGIKVIVANSTFKSSHVAVKEATVSNGTATIDVSEYIGRKLYFIVEKDNEYLSAEVEKTIAEGDNTIALTATAKDYTVKIKVVNNGTAVSGKKVYATDSYSFDGIKYLITLSRGDESKITPSLVKVVTTNGQGIATFENLRPEVSNLNKYTFFVVTNESPYYKQVELTLDGTAKESTISLQGNNNNGGNNNGSGNNNGGNNNSPSEREITFSVLYRNGKPAKDAEMTINGKTLTTDEEGNVKFKLPNQGNFPYVVESPCGALKRGTFDNSYGATLVWLENEVGIITLVNNSGNNYPYYATVNGKTYTIEGGESYDVEVPLGKIYTVSYKQKSGYALYATTGWKQVTISCSSRKGRATFPDK